MRSPKQKGRSPMQQFPLFAVIAHTKSNAILDLKIVTYPAENEEEAVKFFLLDNSRYYSPDEYNIWAVPLSSERQTDIYMCSLSLTCDEDEIDEAE